MARAYLRQSSGLCSGDAQLMAIKQLNAIAHRQGVVMAFADVFLVLTMLFVGLAFLALIMKRPAQVAAGGH